MGRWLDEWMEPQPPLTEEELKALAEPNEALAERRRKADEDDAEAIAEAWDTLDAYEGDEGECDPEDSDHEHGGEG